MKKFYLFMLMAVGLLISTGMSAGNVAKIVENGNEYTTLSAAVSAATSGQTIQLLDNCSANKITIPSGKQLTLNLDKYTITNSGTFSAVIDVLGDLTIDAAKDEDGNWLGGIYGGNYWAIGYGYYTGADGSKLTINGGKFYVNPNSTSSGTNNEVIQVYGDKEQTLIINDGEFIGSGRMNRGTIFNFSGGTHSNKMDITINGGKFYTDITANGSGGGRALFLLQDVNADLKINGGEFEIDRHGGSYQVLSCFDVRGENTSVAITGGKFVNSTTESNGADYCCAALFAYENVKSVTISNASFKSFGPAAWINTSSGNLTKGDVSNVKFESTGDYALRITPYESGQKYVINGGEFRGKYGISIYSNGDKYVSDVEIQWCDVDVESMGVVCQNRMNLSVTGGTIKAGGTQPAIRMMSTGTLTYGGTAHSNGLYLENGTVNINGGSIASDRKSAIQIVGPATVNITGNPIITSNHAEGIAFNSKDGTTEIKGGRFKAASATVSCSGGTTTLYDGIYSLEPIQNDYCAVKPDYEVIPNPDLSTKDVYPYAIGKKTFPVIEVNDDANRTIDWKTITTWAGGNIIPDKGDDVTIADGKNVEVGKSGKTDAYAHQITVDNGSDLIVDGGSKLTVGNGGLTIGTEGDGSEIIIKSTAEDGTGVLLFSPVADEAVTTVEATIELHSTAHKDDEGNYFWNYIGIPLKTDNFTAANWEKVPVTEGQATGSYLQTWDFTEGWVNSGLEAFKPFQGVAITNDSKDGVIYRFKGTMVGNADKNMQFKPRGYNFFANSYTAPIDIETLLNELKDNGVVDAAVYMFDTKNNRFQSVALSAFAGFIPPYFRVIPSMNGFFILNQQTQVSSQTMDYGDAVYNCALGNRPVYAPKHEAMNFSRVHINVEANGSKDGLYLIENEEFTSEFENGYDVMKYMTIDQSNIYVQTAQGAQSELFNSNIEGTMIGFEAAANQTEYTLSFDELQGETFVLTDMETGETIVMSEESTYTFFAQAGQRNDNRFMVTRANKAPTAMDNVKGNVKAQGIYSVMGHYFGNVTEWKNLPSGVYVVNGVKVVK